MSTSPNEVEHLRDVVSDYAEKIKVLERRLKDLEPGTDEVDLPPFMKLYELLWGKGNDERVWKNILVRCEKVEVPIFKVLECYHRPDSGLNDDPLNTELESGGDATDYETGGGEEEIKSFGEQKIEVFQSKPSNTELKVDVGTAEEPKSDPEVPITGTFQEDANETRDTSENITIDLPSHYEAAILEQRNTFKHDPEVFDFLDYGKIQPSSFERANFNFINVYGDLVPYQNSIQDIMPCESGRLLIRENYLEIETYIKSREDGSTGNLGSRDLSGEPARKRFKPDSAMKAKYYVITGQPGIGKSCFQIYLLITRSLSGKPTIVKVRGSHFFFTNEGMRYIRDLTSLSRDERANVDTWYISDGPPDDLLVDGKKSNWTIIVITSAKKEVYKNLVKQNSGTSCVLYMKPWTWPEVFATGVYVEHYNGTEILSTWRHFNLYGPIARTLMKTLEPSHRDLGEREITLRRNIDEEIQKMIQSKSDVYISDVWNDEDSHTVILTEPTKNELTSCRRKVITKFIGWRFAKVDIFFRRLGRQSLFLSLSQIPQAAQLRGFVFEGIVHKLVKSNAKTKDKLTTKDIKSGTVSDISFYGASTFDTLNELQNMTTDEGNTACHNENIINIYLRPSIPNLESIDSLVITHDSMILFQITCAKTYPVNANGLQKIFDRVPASVKNLSWNLIFVIPELKYGEGFGAQRISGRDKSLNEKWEKRLQQHTLQITEEHMAVHAQSHNG